MCCHVTLNVVNTLEKWKAFFLCRKVSCQKYIFYMSDIITIMLASRNETISLRGYESGSSICKLFFPRGVLKKWTQLVRPDQYWALIGHPTFRGEEMDSQLSGHFFFLFFCTSGFV